MASTGTYGNSPILSPTFAIVETSQAVCAICLGIPTNKSFASNCLHEFCFTCLLEWSKVKAECPLCKQPFYSIIHNVKSDHEYDDLEIKKMGKRSSGALQSSPPPLQQQVQHNSVLVQQRNVQFTVGNHLHAPSASARRRSIRTGIRHSAVLPQSEQQTVPQNDLTNIQQPQRKIASTVRYSLRSRIIVQEDMDTTSNVELVNELRPSPPTLSDTLLVENVKATPVRKSQRWHSLVSNDLRNQMVQKFVRAITSDPCFVNQNQMEKVGTYTRQIERDIFMMATSKHMYDTFCMEKMTELKNVKQPEKRIRLHPIHSYESSSSLPQPSATQQVLVMSDEAHFTTENFIETHRAVSEDDEDDDLAILEIPAKPVPEVITLSDSDDE